MLTATISAEATRQAEDTKRSSPIEWATLVLMALDQVVGSLDGRAVVEFGAGEGSVTRLLLDRGARVTPVEAARDKNKKLRSIGSSRLSPILGDWLGGMPGGLRDRHFDIALLLDAPQQLFEHDLLLTEIGSIADICIVETGALDPSRFSAWSEVRDYFLRCSLHAAPIEPPGLLPEDYLSANSSSRRRLIYCRPAPPAIASRTREMGAEAEAESVYR